MLLVYFNANIVITVISNTSLKAFNYKIVKNNINMLKMLEMFQNY